MNPCQLNAVITAITNHLYCTLSKEDFLNLGIFLSLVSKDILSMAAIEGLCKWEERQEKRQDRESGESGEKKEEGKPR